MSVQLARENNIPDGTYYKRLEYGWDKERAATQPVRKCSDPYVAIAEQNGIPKTVYRGRRKNGWTKEEASTIPVGQPRYDKLDEYVYYRKRAMENGIDPAVFNNRVIDDGMSFKEASE